MWKFFKKSVTKKPTGMNRLNTHTMFAEQIETQRNADSNNERPTMNDNQVRLEGKRKRMKVKEG